MNRFATKLGSALVLGILGLGGTTAQAQEAGQRWIGPVVSIRLYEVLMGGEMQMDGRAIHLNPASAGQGNMLHFVVRGYDFAGNEVPGFVYRAELRFPESPELAHLVAQGDNLYQLVANDEAWSDAPAVVQSMDHPWMKSGFVLSVGRGAAGGRRAGGGAAGPGFNPAFGVLRSAPGVPGLMPLAAGGEREWFGPYTTRFTSILAVGYSVYFRTADPAEVGGYVWLRLLDEDPLLPIVQGAAETGKRVRVMVGYPYTNMTGDGKPAATIKRVEVLLD